MKKLITLTLLLSSFVFAGSTKAANVTTGVRGHASRYGRLRLVRPGLDAKDEEGDGLTLAAADLPLAEEIARQKGVAPLLGERLSPLTFRIDPESRGRLKQALFGKQ